jgi:hypothetical protein
LGIVHLCGTAVSLLSAASRLKLFRFFRKTFRHLKQERKNKINWKKIPLSHKIAAVIAGLSVVVWLIAKVQPNL